MICIVFVIIAGVVGYKVHMHYEIEPHVSYNAETMKAETDPAAKESKQKLLEFVEEKNPGILRKVMGGDEDMSSILMEVLKPEIDEKVAKEITTHLFAYVQDGAMLLGNAADYAGMSEAEFARNMEQAGYKVPITARG